MILIQESAEKLIEKGRSVARPLINNIQKITLFQKLRVKLRVVFCSFCRFLDFQLRVFLSKFLFKCYINVWVQKRQMQE